MTTLLRGFNVRLLAGTLPVATLLAAGFQVAAAADLKVVVHDVKSADGKVMVGVFKDPASFPGKMLAGTMADAHPGDVAVVFSGLEAGIYAVSAYQDIDGNGKLNRNLVGIPSEPYGFSRGARGVGGPPSFDDAKFELGAGGAAIDVKLK
jgi:uncharacterized protein (DUF2141 family)